jgi:hypothetical protein
VPLPPWFNLAWWGFRTFVTTEQAAIRAETEPVGAAAVNPKWTVGEDD